ncbi:MAG: shikimate kinase, partial [Bacteroidales bacterium]|nr:shikimate kinase [Bacteroidales bacterium]
EQMYRFLLSSRRNIVLCGMPSSGKSTVGQALAARLGMPFTDTDDVIRTHAGMDIPQIFVLEGEAGFRRRERIAVQGVAGEQGFVVATGGGTVLDPSNVRALKRSGILVFLDRAPQLLEPTADRPLSRDRAALERLYAQRLPVYIAAADARISNDGALTDTVESIIGYAQQG